MELNVLDPMTIILIICAYFMVLMGISYFTAGNSSNTTFFTGGKSSPWWMVAIGMIGATLSGVTFISIPGVVGRDGYNTDFSYMQSVIGYVFGYLFIATVLLPIYYRYNLTSIYQYLGKRLGVVSYKTGAGFFLLSRIIGASFRLYLVAMVLDMFVTGPLGVSFGATVAISILLIWTYTSFGGIKTIVVSDVVQTVSILAAAGLSIYAILGALGYGLTDLPSVIADSPYSQVFFFDEGWSDPNNFFKQFLTGVCMTIAMTGLDQDMMQKNLTCKTLKDSQKNMATFSIILVIANLLFLSLGALMYMYIADKGLELDTSADKYYPTIALQHLGPAVAVTFILGLIAAAYSSADSALTSLTTSFCVDFLGMKAEDNTTKNEKMTRFAVHLGFSFVLFLVIMVFHWINDDSVINKLFKVSGYTYGPLMGLFGFAIFTRRRLRDDWVLLICVISVIICYVLDVNSKEWFNGFTFGFLNLLLNGLLTFGGLMLLSLGLSSSKSKS